MSLWLISLQERIGLRSHEQAAEYVLADYTQYSDEQIAYCRELLKGLL